MMQILELYENHESLRCVEINVLSTRNVLACKHDYKGDYDDTKSPCAKYQDIYHFDESADQGE